MIADHRRNLGRIGKRETLPILQICPPSSQTIGDIFDLEFLLVGKIWDSQETVKSPIVWDFRDIWEPGFRLKVNISRSADEITQDSRQQPRSQVLSPALRADSTCGIWSWCYIFFAFLKFRNQSVLLLISPLIYHFHFDHCLVSGRVYCIVQHKSDLPHTHTTDIPLPSPHSCV